MLFRSVVKEIHVIVKAENAIYVEIPDSEEIIITSAEGFVRDLETGENVIFEGRWYITSTKDSGVVTTIFGEYMPELETEGEMAGYYYFEL